MNPKFNLGDKVSFKGTSSIVHGQIIEIYVPTPYTMMDEKEVTYDILVQISKYHTPVTYRKIRESRLEKDENAKPRKNKSTLI